MFIGEIKEATAMVAAHSEKEIARHTAVKRIAVAIGYLVAVVLAVYIRTYSSFDVIANPKTNIQDIDSISVLRTIDIIVHHYPSLPLFDSFANFPWGMKAQLPPLWAFIEASFGKIVNMVFGIPVISAASLFPVVAGIFLAIPMYYAGKYLFSRAVGHAACILSLFLPVIVLASSVAMVDHHIADLVLYSSLIALLAASHKMLVLGKRMLGDALSVAAGLVVTFTLLISLSSILIVAIVWISLILGLFLLPKKERRFTSRIGGLALGSAGLSMLLLYVATPWFAGNLSFSGLSLFQPLLLLGLTTMLLVSNAIDILFARRRTILQGVTRSFFDQNLQNVYRILSLSMLYIILLISVFTLPSANELISKAFYRSIGYYPLAQVNDQLLPLFSDGPAELILRFSVFAYVLPFGFVYLIGDTVVKRSLNFGRLFFLVWFAVSAAYFIIARYYMFLFAPAALIMFGFIIARLSGLFSVLFERVIKKPIARPASIAFLLVVTIGISCYLFVWTTSSIRVARPDAGWIAMLKWIKENTPEVSHYLNPERPPEYGIVTDWFSGNYLVLIAERPTLSTVNQETGMDGIIASYKIFQTESEDELIQLMKRYRLRYILLGADYAAWQGDIEQLGEPGPRPDEIAYLPTIVPAEEHFHISSARLYRFWGAGNEQFNIDPMQHFRLVKITGTSNQQTWKLFEFVKGTRLIVKAPPGSRIEVATEILPEGAGVIPWKLSRISDDDGMVEVFLPYATSKSPYSVKARPYRVLIGNKTYYLDLAESDVIEGRTVHITSIP
ncbi:MAG: hypothetical protein K6T91_01185 [Firmicutes bacterium]|nr:hypothetical protein [Bacillota bacterium]